MRVLILTAALTAIGGGSSFAASFDCGKAGTPVEKAVCSDERLSNLDSELGRAYKAALQNSTAPADLKTEQKNWIAQRNRCTDVTCLASAYQTRLAALSAPQHATPAAATVSGTYKAAGGELLVAQESVSTIKFSLSAMYKMNTGEVEGVAILNGNHAIFASNDESDYGDCKIEFTFTESAVNVRQDGICGMGFNVNGTGNYKRQSKAAPTF
ncbi:lysozyme inhibitor LprI family protein [Azospirillum sp. TSH64]|uniref:lysozyme inhibitor LprI family protein n=1 Tax=Azospirillum sp. TSH64 TaxID=652740 RepID=UPI000D690591|nr:lysozyme inhibitor LprI family protein [Azospirillum sp. TSH64]